MTSETTSPNELQLDVLREVANIGAGHAAKALGELMGGERMDMDIPRAVKVDTAILAGLLGGEAAPVVAVSLGLGGSLSGKLVLVWSEEGASNLVSWLLRGAGPTNQRSPIANSALTEAANVIASACLTAVGDLTGLKLMPSVPTLKRGTAVQLARTCLAQVESEDPTSAWVLEVKLSSKSFNSELLLIPDPASMAVLLKQLGV